MKIIVMTLPFFFVEEDKIISALFNEGMSCLHLNKPNSASIYSERLLTLLPDNCNERIITHQNYHLKNEYELKGIHIDDQNTLPPAHYKGHISRTCCAVEDLKTIKKNADYVFLRKISPHKEFTFPELKDAYRRGFIGKKVYFQSRIDLNNIHTIRDLGFEGVVICEDLWEKFDPFTSQDYKEIIAYFRKIHKEAK